MRRDTPCHLGQLTQPLHGLAIQRHLAERSGKAVRLRQCQATDVNAMGGAEQYHPVDAATQRPQLRVSAGRDRTGIDIACVRHNQRLGRARRRTGRGICQQRVYGVPELGRIVRIEHSGNGSGSDNRHAIFPLCSA